MSHHGEITDEAIAQFLATVDKVPKPIRQIARSGEGGEHLVWIINDAFVLRVPADKQDSTLLVREEASWQVLKSIEPSISTIMPTCLEIGVWDAIKRPFGLYQKLPGVSIEASPSSVNAATESDLAHMLLLFQKMPIRRARAAGLADAAEPLDLFELRQRALAAWQRLLSRNNNNNNGGDHLENLLPRGQDMDQALHISESDAHAPYPPVFLHADLKGEHIFVDRDTGRLTGVIDWSDACVGGDPAVDICGLAISVGAAAAARIAAEAGYDCHVAARGVVMARCDSLICLDAIMHQDDDSPEWLVRLQLQRALERGGFEALKQLLQAPQPYRVVLGARDPSGMQLSLRDVPFESANKIEVLPLDLADLKGTRTFAEATLDTIGDAKIDYLFLNAGITKPAVVNPRGYRWCESAVVNHVAQFYLVHLLREKLVTSKSRIVFVSSGAVTSVSDPGAAEETLKSGSGAADFGLYAMTKFVQLLGAHWWRRELTGVCDVVAVSPGLVPGTGLARGSGIELPAGSPDARTVPQGARSLLAALTRSDFPQDPDRIFLTSWGEWWEKSVFEKTLDRELQDKWSFSKEDIEKEAGISA